LCGILIAFFSHSKEPLGDRMLNAATNKQGLTRIAAEVLLTDLSIQLHKLYIRDYFTKEELEEYVKCRAASREVIKEQRDALKSYRRNIRFTLRMFWNAKAHGAARRQLKTNHPPQEFVNELAWLFEDIFRQQKGRCMYCFAPLRVSKGKAWNNASPDRRAPAKREGEYSRHNVDIVCVGCQSCKWWYRPTEFRVLVHTMAHAHWKVKTLLLLNSEPKLPVEMSVVEKEKLVIPWCKKVLNALRTRRHCLLDVNDLITLLQTNWMGKGFVKDSAGIAGPLEIMSIDRLNSSAAYVKGNIRLLLWGLNNLKKNDANDLHVIKYLQHLRDHRFTITAEMNYLADTDKVLPFEE
jgi:hypothetical protein